MAPETYNRAHNILELLYISPNVSFTTSETRLDYCWYVKYELTDELPEENLPDLRKSQNSMEL